MKLTLTPLDGSVDRVGRTPAIQRGVTEVIGPLGVGAISAIFLGTAISEWIQAGDAIRTLNSYGGIPSMAGTIEASYRFQTYVLFTIAAALILAAVYALISRVVLFKRRIGWAFVIVSVLVLLGWLVSFLASLAVSSPGAHFAVGITGAPAEVNSSIVEIIEFQTFGKYSGIAVENFALLVSFLLSAAILTRHTSRKSVVASVLPPSLVWVLITGAFSPPNTVITVSPGAIVWFTNAVGYPFTPPVTYIEILNLIYAVTIVVLLYLMTKGIVKLPRNFRIRHPRPDLR